MENHKYVVDFSKAVELNLVESIDKDRGCIREYVVIFDNEVKTVTGEEFAFYSVEGKLSKNEILQRLKGTSYLEFVNIRGSFRKGEEVGESYYVPKIEEFHKGFEFEYRPLNMIGNFHKYSDNWIKSAFGYIYNDWHSDRYLIPIALKDIETFIKDDCIRVKYLDEKDIISLGFKRKECSKNIIYEAMCNTSFLRPCSLISIIQDNLTWLVMSESYSGINSTLFAGNIKNRDELIKILNQLEIEVIV